MIFFGDTHNDTEAILDKLIRYGITDESIFHVGDYNIGFSPYHIERRELTILNNYCKSKGIFFYVTEGNHDDPNYFCSDKSKFAAYLKTRSIRFMYPRLDVTLEKVHTDLDEYAEFIFSLSNIKFVENYSVITVDEDKVLCVGGAISVDRCKQPIGIKYWKEEAFVLDVEKLSNMRGITHVVTHTAPSFCYPHTTSADIVKHYMTEEGDLTLESELIKERADVAEMYNILTKNNEIKMWCYGHFHQQYLEEINGTKFKLLTINEMY